MNWTAFVVAIALFALVEIALSVRRAANSIHRQNVNARHMKFAMWQIAALVRLLVEKGSDHRIDQAKSALMMASEKAVREESETIDGDDE